MITATLQEVKANFSRFIEQVESGDEIVIVKGKGAVARIVPVKKPWKRNLAVFKGQFRVGPEFCDPLPEDELRAWDCAGE